MIQNRCTSNIPINVSSIADIMYGPSTKLNKPFVSADEINQKTSISKDYSERIEGVDYKSFGPKIKL